jgi:hypothetical protein
MNRRLSDRRVVAAALSAVVALALAACSSPGGGDPGSGGGTGKAAPKSAPATKAPASHSTAPGALSGTWSGHYSGAYSGSFTVKWKQTGSRLHGTIKLSNPGDTLPINGTVNGSSISFGTVGSTAITYEGTVSGSSMSGSYKVHSTNGSSGGPWSAAKA